MIAHTKRVTDMLALLAAVCACIVLVAMVLIILYEIVLRTAFDSSTYVLDEFVGYGVATLTFLSFASALKDGTFIRVNLILSVLGPLSRRTFEVISHVLGAVLFAFVGINFLKFVMRDFSRGTVSNSVAQTPLWVPQAIMLVGITILVLQFVVLAIHFARGAEIINVQKEL